MWYGDKIPEKIQTVEKIKRNIYDNNLYLYKIIVSKILISILIGFVIISFCVVCAYGAYCIGYYHLISQKVVNIIFIVVFWIFFSALIFKMKMKG